MDNNEFNNINNNELNNMNNNINTNTNKPKKSIFIIVVVLLIIIICGLELYYKRIIPLNNNKIVEKDIDNSELKKEIANIIESKYAVTIDTSKLKITEYIEAHTEKRNQCTFSRCFSDQDIPRYARLRYEDRTFTLVGDSVDFFSYDVVNNTKEHYASLLGLNKDSIYLSGSLEYREGKRCASEYQYFAVDKYNKSRDDNYLEYGTLGIFIKLDKNNLEDNIKSLIDRMKENHILPYNVYIIDANEKVEESYENLYEKDRHDEYCIKIDKKKIIAHCVFFSGDSDYTMYNGFAYKIY